MTYEEWESSVPIAVRADALWRVKAYRLAAFLADLAWIDIGPLAKQRRINCVCDQLYRAVGSIGANLAEGYSRGTGRDRARFYEYSLGSARESRHWYMCIRQAVTSQVLEHRFSVLTEITKLVLAMIPNQRTARGFERALTV